MRTVLPNKSSIQENPQNSEGNSVIYAQSKGKYFYPNHKTPYLFVANFLNTGNYVVNNNRISISEKYFYFLNLNDELEINFHKEVPLQTLLISFEDEFVKSCMDYIISSDRDLLNFAANQINNNFEFPSIPFNYSKKLMLCINSIIWSEKSNQNINSLLFNLLYEFILTNKDATNNLNRIRAVKKSTKEELYKRLFFAREFMIDNLSENVTIEQIAQESCLNKFHFLSTFKDVFKTTPHQYLTELKLQKAHQLLKKSKYSVTEICFDLGFTSVGSFSNLFKRRYGVSPSTILRNH